MKSKASFLLLICVALTACAPSPPITPIALKESLASKSSEERKELLMNACLDEAVWRHGRHLHPLGYTALCEEMYAAMEQ